MSSVDNQPKGGAMPDGDAKKINVSFDETEKEFNETEKTLEDIIDEELANSEREPEFKEEPKEEPVEIPVGIKDEEEAEAPEIEEEPKAFEPTVSRVAVETNDAAGIDERPVRASRKKSGKGIIVFLIILIILIAGAFLAYYLLSTQTIKNDFFAGNDTKCETPKADPVDKEAVADLKDEEEVIKVVDGIRAEIEKNHDKSAALITTFNQTMPMHKINEDGTLFALNKSYGLYYAANGEGWETFVSQLNSETVSALTSLGFTEYTTGLSGLKYYYDEKTNIICGPIDEGISGFWAVSCANESWVSDNEDLAVELAETYKKKQGSSLISIYVNKDNIKDSGKNKDYQAVMAQGGTQSGGAAQIFYKKKTDSEWTYAYAAQATPSCSLFDEEMREALSGWTGHSDNLDQVVTCLNEETGVEEEV